MSIRPSEIRFQYRVSVYAGFVFGILGWLLVVAAILCALYKAYSFALLTFCAASVIFMFARKFLNRAKAIRRPFIMKGNRP